jgi:16S rRNA (guanine527-N7)-methyltransferase
VNINDFLHQTLTANNFNLSKELETRFYDYLLLLQKWNRVYNLTAIRNPSDMVLLHIADSLSINPYLHGDRILDVGTGAGLPGIPLALLNPDKHFVLLDSNSKKTRFLIQALQTLNIQNVEVIHARCEDFQSEEGFTTIVSRAFASIQVMLTTTRHLIGQDGQFLAMKGVYPEQELLEISPRFQVINVHELKIQGLDAERHVVCIKGNR